MVHVPDVEQGLRWYEEAFPGARREQLVAPVQFEYLAVGDVRIELVPSDAKATNGAAGSIVYWYAHDFQATLDHMLSVGATLYRGPRVVEHGEKMCQVRDPWGNCIGLRGPSTRSDPGT